jgi:hypothetical protein
LGIEGSDKFSKIKKRREVLSLRSTLYALRSLSR